MKKRVYLAMAADIIHPGHIFIINKASRLGEVIIGVLTDRAIASYKRVPFMPFKDRILLVSSLKNVSKTIKQSSLDYTKNLIYLKPDFVVHGDDWKKGVQKNTRESVINVLSNWGGKLIEYPYTKGYSSTRLIKALRNV